LIFLPASPESACYVALEMVQTVGEGSMNRLKSRERLAQSGQLRLLRHILGRSEGIIRQSQRRRVGPAFLGCIHVKLVLFRQRASIWTPEAPKVVAPWQPQAMAPLASVDQRKGCEYSFCPCLMGVIP
jgi:hypothetical protein